MRRHPALEVLALGFVALGGAGAARADFAFTTQARSVAVTITQTTLSCLPPPSGCSLISSSQQSDAETAPDFSTFSATAMVPSFPQSFATQDSTLGAASIQASGNTEGASGGGFVSPPNIFGTTQSALGNSFSSGFSVAAPMPYRLSGSVAASGGLSANTTTRVTLKTSGGAVIAEVIAASDPDCQDNACFEVGPLPIASYGVLAPGAYVLEAVATTNASPFYFAGNFIGLGSSGAYEVTLAEVAAPALSRGGVAALVAGLALAALAALRHGERPRG
jgi:hypothetical protein